MMQLTAVQMLQQERYAGGGEPTTPQQYAAAGQPLSLMPSIPQAPVPLGLSHQQLLVGLDAAGQPYWRPMPPIKLPRAPRRPAPVRRLEPVDVAMRNGVPGGSGLPAASATPPLRDPRRTPTPGLAAAAGPAATASPAASNYPRQLPPLPPPMPMPQIAPLHIPPQADYHAFILSEHVFPPTHFPILPRVWPPAKPMPPIALPPPGQQALPPTVPGPAQTGDGAALAAVKPKSGKAQPVRDGSLAAWSRNKVAAHQRGQMVCASGGSWSALPVPIRHKILLHVLRDDGDNAAFATVRSVCWQWRAVANRFAPLVMGLAMNGGDANSTPGSTPRQSA